MTGAAGHIRAVAAHVGTGDCPGREPWLPAPLCPPRPPVSSAPKSFVCSFAET